MRNMTDNTKGRSGVASPLSGLIRFVARRLAVHENVTYGKSFRVGRGVVMSSPHGLRVGNFVSVGPHTIIQVDGSIGDFSLIGMGVQIVGRRDHAHDEVGTPIVYSTWVADRVRESQDVVTIGRDVWIGGASVVLSGVTIGEGSIIGSGSVVTRDIPEYSIAVGNPARVVRSRFSSAEDIMIHRAALDLLAQSLAES
jgi:acetyltransferase-like isoleucine patch superfamily enzyme